MGVNPVSGQVSPRNPLTENQSASAVQPKTPASRETRDTFLVTTEGQRFRFESLLGGGVFGTSPGEIAPPPEDLA